MTIGLNSSWAWRWSGNQTSINIVERSGNWNIYHIWPRPDGFNHGNVEADFPESFVDGWMVAPLPAAWIDPDGNQHDLSDFLPQFTLLNEANGDTRFGLYVVVGWQGNGVVEIGGVTVDLDTDEWGDPEFDYQGGAVHFRCLDPQGWADPPRDIIIVHENDISLWGAGKRWRRDFCALVGQAECYRPMDWLPTNFSAVTTLNEWNAGETRRTWKSVPLPAICRMVTESGVRALWLNTPHLMARDEVRRVLEHQNNHMPIWCHQRFGYSNETWNWAFGQAQDLEHHPEKFAGEPQAFTDLDNTWARTGWKTMQLAVEAKAVFSADFGSRCRIVQEVQTATDYNWFWANRYVSGFDAYLAEYAISGTWQDYIHEIGWTAYFSPRLEDAIETALVAEGLDPADEATWPAIRRMWADAILTGGTPLNALMKADGVTPYFKTLDQLKSELSERFAWTRGLGLEPVIYEWNHHTDGGSDPFKPFRDDLDKSAEMGEVLTAVGQWLNDQGIPDPCIYHDFRADTFGLWPSIETATDIGDAAVALAAYQPNASCPPVEPPPVEPPPVEPPVPTDDQFALVWETVPSPDRPGWLRTSAAPAIDWNPDNPPFFMAGFLPPSDT